MPTKTTTHTHVSSNGTRHVASFTNGNGKHTATFTTTKTNSNGGTSTKKVQFKK